MGEEKGSKVFYSWNIQPRINLNDWDVKDMGQLLQLVERYPLRKRAYEDVRLWLGENKGFSVKSMYEVLSSTNRPLFPNSVI